MEIIWTTVMALVAISALVGAMYGMPSENKLVRILLAVSAIAMLWPGSLADIAGIILCAAALVLARITKKKESVSV